MRAALGFKMRYSGIRVGDIIRVMVRCLWNGDQISQYGDWIKFQISVMFPDYDSGSASGLVKGFSFDSHVEMRLQM